MKKIIDSGDDWSWEKIEWIFEEIQKIALEEYGISDKDIYPNQIEIVNFEQMLDAYSRHGMPLGPDHWSIGESFVKQSQAYKHRHMGLAFEIVLNSSPTINYLMEQNSMVMQALVLAHAAIGHNFFFKNNYLFKEWTDAEGIIDYLLFARNYVRDCEMKYGAKEVEKILDSAYALQYHGVDKYKRPSKLSAAKEEKRKEERDQYLQSQLNEVWNSLPKKSDPYAKGEFRFVKEPQENILYFIEKNAPRLESWKREIIRIVRKTSQYFYPQMQTKNSNEGFATWTHYNIVNKLYDRGFMTDGAMLEFLASHTGVIGQSGYDSKYYGGINPYTLGFNIYRDIQRISTDPTQEDRDWFKDQEWVGNGKVAENVKFAASNFKDDSFILQYLSPKVMRDLKFFAVHDDDADDFVAISGIHNDQGYKMVRSKLSKSFDINRMIPNLQVTYVDIWGDRSMVIEHTVENRRLLDEKNAQATLTHLAHLWGYPVLLQSVDHMTGETIVEWDSEPDMEELLDFKLSDL